jgi:hypothetical protein
MASSPFTPAVMELFLPTRPPAGLDPPLIIKLVNGIKKITANLDSNDKINTALTSYCNLILVLNGQNTKQPIRDEDGLDNTSGCSYLNTKPKSNIGCKTNDAQYDEKKRFIMSYLKNILIHIFEKALEQDASLLRNTDPYIILLKKAVEFFCHFIGSKELNPIYATYVLDLVDRLNALFPEPVLINRCSPSDRLYGCARIINIVRRNANVQINKFKILLLSSDNDNGGDLLNSRANLRVAGGFRKIKSKKQRKLRNNKTVKRRLT